MWSGGAGDTGSTQRQPQPLQLLLRCVTLASSFQNRDIHLVEVRYCEDTRPNNQLEASKQQHRDLCRHLSMTSGQVTLHTILLGVDRVIYSPPTFKPPKELASGLDTHKATKLAPKLHAHNDSVQYAYKLISKRKKGKKEKHLAPLAEGLSRRLLSTLISKIRHGLLL
eukprot:132764-Pelagomonas_calceolata.AAC.1